jgi:peptidoglycan hydrolase-like protein with peptidoglycan-binding domain
MKTLAECFVVAYEGSSPSSKLGTFESLNVNAIKAMKSTIAVGFVAVGVFAGTTVQAETVQKALSYGDRGLVVAALQSKLGGIAVDGIFGSQTLTKLKSYQAVNKLAVDGVATKETLASLGTSNLAQAVPHPEQYGKLKLINDTRYEKIIFVYQPGEEKYSRYAYLPGCSQRTLLSTYSNRSQVSLDLEKKASIGNLKNSSFEFKVSSLDEDKYSICPGQSQANGTKPTDGQSQANGGQPTAKLVGIERLGSLGQQLARKTTVYAGKEAAKMVKAFPKIANRHLHNTIKSKKMLKSRKSNESKS